MNTYNNFGIQTTSQSGSVQDMSYSYDLTNGNLNSFTDNATGNAESYAYDNLDRLKTITNTNYGLPYTISYDVNGNISSKYDAGAYTYHGTKLNQVIIATNSQSQINQQQQDVTYNAFDKVNYVLEGNNSANIYYDANGQRYKTVFKTNNTITNTRYYLNGMERNIDAANNITDVNYIDAPTGLTAMLVNEPINGSSINYVYKDFVGSIVAVTDENGGNVVRQNFDAWGRKRDPSTHSYSSISSVPTWLTRGYTGHEHLPEFTLINMNGRMYDPILSRMLSVDPIITDPLNSQDYNKYSYVRNNPLKFTDPTGLSPAFGSNLMNYLTLGAVVKIATNNAGILYGLTEWTDAGADAQYQSTYYQRIPMSSVNTGPGKNDVGDWMENIVYSSTYRKWESTLARNKFDEENRVYEQGGPMDGTIEEQSPGHWVEANEMSIFYDPGVSAGTDPGDDPPGSKGKSPSGSNLLERFNFGLGHLATMELGLGVTGALLTGKDPLFLGIKLNVSSTANIFGQATSQIATKFGQTATWVGAPLAIASEYNLYNTGMVSGQRFAFRTTGIIASTLVGHRYGPLAGAATSGGFWGMEQAYEGFNFWFKSVSNMITVTEMGLRNGWVPR